MSSSWCRRIATVIAIGISGIANSTSTGVPATRAHGTTTAITTTVAISSQASWLRSRSPPRR